MTADEQLRRAFDTFTDRLRGHLVREVEAAAADVTAAVEAIEAERARAIAAAVADAREAADAEHAGATAAAVADAREATAQDMTAKLAADLAAAAGEADRRARDQADAHARALEAAERRAHDAIEQANRQAHERTALAVRAARADIRTAELAAAERLVDTIRAIDRGRSLSEILDTLVSGAGREASRVAVLLVRDGLLRGWRFIGFGSSVDGCGAFELPLAGAGVIADAVRAGAPTSADRGPRAAAPPFDELPDGRESLAIPVAMGGQIVAVLYADQGAVDRADRIVPLTWPDTLEVMARHAARCLEALTAATAARVLARPDVPSSSGGDAAARSSDTEEEESARRFARLLVSEIKLYHEATVAAGRRERDLMARLGGEIARARALYDQRIPASLRERTDYFHAELVRTLANGDAALLGQPLTA